MDFTEQELSSLNAYFNGSADLPVGIEAINVKLRSHFEQDNSIETPEEAAAVEADPTDTEAVAEAEEPAE